jgi:serine/threonine-protein kinase
MPLSPERWREISPYLDEALEIAVDQQAAWLATIRARDPGLAADLQMLLAEQRAAQQSGFLEGALQISAFGVPAASLSGQILGPYRLLSLIGQGGMGSVWLAERCDGRFEGLAAVKLLNASVVGRAGEERFRREGDILARLRHAHIAHLIDAGVSPTGQPYLILEYVDGQSIDRYCNARGLGIEARLHLIEQDLGEPLHGPQRGAHVVGDRVGEMLQLIQGFLKLGSALAHFSTMPTRGGVGS